MLIIAEDWNGSSWSSGTMIPSGRHVENGMSMVGSASDLCVAGGRDGPAQPYPGVAYKWDGSSWSTLAPRPPSLPSSHSVVITFVLVHQVQISIL